MKWLALLALLSCERTRVTVDQHCAVSVQTSVADVVVRADVHLVPVIVPMPMPFERLAEKAP